MLVGIVVGPFGLVSFAAASALALRDYHQRRRTSIEPIAQLGVVLLLFMIGLELSFERLWVMRRLVFGLGSAAGRALRRGAGRRRRSCSGMAGSALR